MTSTTTNNTTATATSVLVVDDDVGIIETLQYLLLNEGYDVVVAKNGQDAIDVYRETRPDAVLMDIRMPIMNGFDAFFKIKEMDKNAQVILTSSYAIEDKEYQRAKKMGLGGILSKPFSFENIIKMINRCQN